MGILATESQLRQHTYLQRGGCNVFAKQRISSHPLSIWTEDDIWAYIRKYNVPYCELYNAGIGRTGCICCEFGCTNKNDARFRLLYQRYPKMYEMCMNYSNNGITYREALRILGVLLPDEELPF